MEKFTFYENAVKISIFNIQRTLFSTCFTMLYSSIGTKLTSKHPREYVTFVLALFVPRLSFFWCFTKALFVCLC